MRRGQPVCGALVAGQADPWQAQPEPGWFCMSASVTGRAGEAKTARGSQACLVQDAVSQPVTAGVCPPLEGTCPAGLSCLLPSASRAAYAAAQMDQHA